MAIAAVTSAAALSAMSVMTGGTLAATSRAIRGRTGTATAGVTATSTIPVLVVYAARPVIYSAAPTVNRCTCLTKEYTQEGAVLFKDICTNEAAINPPPAPGADRLRAAADDRSAGPIDL